MNKATIGMVSILAAIISAEKTSGQGSLTPPGAPVPAMKTLEQVEPRIDLATVTGNVAYHHVVSEPGSYYLSGNLEVTGANGIWVNAADVTLDLNGFRVFRVSGSGGYGIYLSSGTDRACVRNGIVDGFHYGIGGFSKCCLIEKVTATSCTYAGIYCGISSRITDCRAQGNQGSYGIYAREGSTLAGCIANGNQSFYGIVAGSGSSLAGCTATDNAGTGIQAGSSSSMVGCAAEGNLGTYAIRAGAGSSLRQCTAESNQGEYGLYADAASSLDSCTARLNFGRYGIFAGNGSILRNCVANSNEGSDSSTYGIHAAAGSSLIGCISRNNSNTTLGGTSNQGVGIYAYGSGVVKDCTVSNNEGDGIQVFNDCLISGNACNNNGSGGDGAGIHALSQENRIEGNNVTDNDRGIDVDASGNLVIHNSARGNGVNYDIVASNAVGAVVNATLSGAISGDSGGVGIGTSGSYVNITY